MSFDKKVLVTFSDKNSAHFSDALANYRRKVGNAGKRFSATKMALSSVEGSAECFEKFDALTEGYGNYFSELDHMLAKLQLRGVPEQGVLGALEVPEDLTAAYDDFQSFCVPHVANIFYQAADDELYEAGFYRYDDSINQPLPKYSGITKAGVATLEDALPVNVLTNDVDSSQHLNYLVDYFTTLSASQSTLIDIANDAIREAKVHALKSGGRRA